MKNTENFNREQYIYLESVASIRSSYEDVATPVSSTEDECECTTEGPDGYLDFTLKFRIQEIVTTFGQVSDGDLLPLTLTGVLYDGTPIEATDCVTVIKKNGKIRDSHEQVKSQKGKNKKRDN